VLSDGRAIEPRVKRLRYNLKRHILSAENVTSTAQGNVTSAGMPRG